MEIEGPLPRDWGRPFGVSGETARGLALAALPLAGRRDPSRPPSLSLPRQQGRDGRLASLVTVGRIDDASPRAECSPTPPRAAGAEGGGGHMAGRVHPVGADVPSRGVAASEASPGPSPRQFWGRD